MVGQLWNGQAPPRMQRLNLRNTNTHRTHGGGESSNLRSIQRARMKLERVLKRREGSPESIGTRAGDLNEENVSVALGAKVRF
jgi:hypothetical protein